MKGTCRNCGGKIKVAIFKGGDFCSEDCRVALVVKDTQRTAEDCVFCQIVAGDSPAEIVAETLLALAFVPLNPVVPGHILVIPKTHTPDFTDKWSHVAAALALAGELAPENCNLITSRGEEATQTVFHCHFHIVPRTEGDGLSLPWTGQKTGA